MGVRKNGMCVLFSLFMNSKRILSKYVQPVFAVFHRIPIFSRRARGRVRVALCVCRARTRAAGPAAAALD